ncbi:hypothetical protein KCU61_g299, partial [Aureobasidium melanogenum]
MLCNVVTSTQMTTKHGRVRSSIETDRMPSQQGLKRLGTGYRVLGNALVDLSQRPANFRACWNTNRRAISRSSNISCHSSAELASNRLSSQGSPSWLAACRVEPRFSIDGLSPLERRPVQPRAWNICEVVRSTRFWGLVSDDWTIFSMNSDLRKCCIDLTKQSSQHQLKSVARIVRPSMGNQTLPLRKQSAFVLSNFMTRYSFGPRYRNKHRTRACLIQHTLTHQVRNHFTDTMDSLVSTTVRDGLYSCSSIIEGSGRVEAGWRKLFKALRERSAWYHDLRRVHNCECQSRHRPPANAAMREIWLACAITLFASKRSYACVRPFMQFDCTRLQGTAPKSLPLPELEDRNEKPLTHLVLPTPSQTQCPIIKATARRSTDSTAERASANEVVKSTTTLTSCKVLAAFVLAGGQSDKLLKRRARAGWGRTLVMGLYTRLPPGRRR